MAAYSLGQLTTFIVTNIARRRADQTGNSMLLHIFAHIDTDHITLVVKQNLSQRLRQLRLADTGRPQEDKGTDRPAGVFDSRTGTHNCLADSFNSVVLANDPLMQDILQMHQFFAFATAQPGYRNTGPGADDLGDIFLVNLFLQQYVVVGIFIMGLHFGQFFFQRRQTAILQFCQFIQIIAALSTFHFLFYGVDFFLYLAHTGDRSLFSIPAFDQRLVFLPQFGQFFFDLRQTILRLLILLFPQSLSFDLQLQDTALTLVQLGRQRIDLRPQTGSRLVHQVDSLIRQETVINITVTQNSSSYQRRVFDPYTVMHFITLFQTTQDRNRILNTRLLDHYRLETPFQSAVFFDILTVFIQRRCADTAQLAAGQHRFQDIASVHCAFGSASADHRMQLVDKHNDLPGRIRNHLQHLFQTLFKLAAVFGACYQCRQIQSIQGLVLQVFRYVASHDTPCQTFGDSSFTNARFAYQHRIVFLAARQDLDHTTDLLITADNRIQLTVHSFGRQILTIFFQGLFTFFVSLSVSVSHI